MTHKVGDQLCGFFSWLWPVNLNVAQQYPSDAGAYQTVAYQYGLNLVAFDG
jgi:hypothetical protein